ncbi:rhodanese-like domain-containing protein [Thermodesulfobacteriota bacterium]
MFANGFPAWKKHPNYFCIEANTVKSKIDNKKKLVLIDSRPKRAKYDKGHIPGAVSIPDRTFDKMVDKLPQDKETPLIFYCEGYT